MRKSVDMEASIIYLRNVTLFHVTFNTHEQFSSRVNIWNCLYSHQELLWLLTAA